MAAHYIKTTAKQTRSCNLNAYENKDAIKQQHSWTPDLTVERGDQTFVGLSPTRFPSISNTPHASIHSLTVCPQLPGPRTNPWVLTSRQMKVQQPWRGHSPAASPTAASAVSDSTCRRRTTRAPWPARGSRGRKPPLRSSSRRTWGRRSASAGGRFSGWAGGSLSPAR